ncbi:VacJ family lipoprotein [Pseudomonas sp. ABC1]|uniref:MlaA family lipoprotein n=1 Tax=Pseudomonas sp. ABC1 TaxID=2748080 RepID=UPI00211A51D0|nr:VacJ family lipoprotein [Pseudomonas sp. ABC1]
MPSSSPVLRTLAIAAFAVFASGCATQPPSVATDACPVRPVTEHDPAESLNRGVFAFNRTLDRYLLAPVARGYRHLPLFVQHGVHNFVANFGEPKVFINDLLQGNAQRSARTVGRFALNTTVGIVGLVDVSGRMGIERHQADFGQTFGVWNIADGPVVELPLLGTGNLRDASGRVLGLAISPFGDNSDTLDALATFNTVGGVIDGRAEALPLTRELEQAPDYYAALRDTVAEQRADFVREGKAGVPVDCSDAAALDD